MRNIRSIRLDKNFQIRSDSSITSNLNSPSTASFNAKPTTHTTQHDPCAPLGLRSSRSALVPVPNGSLAPQPMPGGREGWEPPCLTAPLRKRFAEGWVPCVSTRQGVLTQGRERKRNDLQKAVPPKVEMSNKVLQII
jgi:hypothetical protein